jgi:hypothetical protein
LDEFGRDITLRNVDRERGRNDRRDFKKDERTDGKGDDPEMLLMTIPKVLNDKKLKKPKKLKNLNPNSH